MKQCNSQDHVGDRLVDDEEFRVRVSKTNPTGFIGVCKSCMSARRRREREKNKERVKREQAEWRDIHREELSSYDKEYRASSRGREVRAKSYEKNRAQKRMYDKLRWQNDPNVRARHMQVCARRRAALLRAVPRWADDEMDQIKALYNERYRISVETGVDHHVDHIIPLQSDVVCGLHCLANLRIIPAFDNISKGNRLHEDLIYDVWEHK